MYIFRFKKFLFLLLISVFTFSVKAQQTHFVYLQTDNGQPFYVKLNNKVISSSSQGYVILPGINDGEYHITVGFPKKEHPEETFSLNIDNNNEGFVIKNFEDNQTELFNLQTLALVKGASDSQKIVVADKKDTDAFSTMLASVVKDSSILQNHQMQAAPVVSAKTDSSAGLVKTDTPSVANNSETVSVVNNEAKLPKTDSQVTKNDSVSKLVSEQSSLGLTMIYSDKNPGKTDTVSVFMPSQNVPAETGNAAEQNKNQVVSSISDKKNADSSLVEKDQKSDASSFNQKTDYTITPTPVKPGKDSAGFVYRKDSVTTNTDTKTRPVQVFTIGPAKDEHSKKLEDIPVEKKKTDIEKSDSSSKPANHASKAELVLMPKVITSSKVNSDCKGFATNEDFLRLRKKMASENNQEDMIRTALKYFKSKCYSTEQIKDLSYLFLTEEGKYMFFDAAYAHTSDSDQYEMLESQLTDPYYQNRFKAMIRK